MDAEFLVGSRKCWITVWKGFYIAPPDLNDRVREMVRMIGEACTQVNCPGGVPYSLFL